MTLETTTGLALWLFGGIAFGAVYMHLIARSVAALGPPTAYGAAAGWLILRVALAAAVLALAAMQGAGPLLTALAGFLVARTVVIRRTARE